MTATFLTGNDVTMYVGAKNDKGDPVYEVLGWIKKPFEWEELNLHQTGTTPLDLGERVRQALNKPELEALQAAVAADLRVTTINEPSPVPLNSYRPLTDEQLGEFLQVIRASQP